LNETGIRPGDILVHDPSNGNKLIVYRNKDIFKIMTLSPLGMQTMLKNDWVSVHEEPSAPPTPVKAVEKAPNLKNEAPKVKVEAPPKKIFATGDELMSILKKPEGSPPEQHKHKKHKEQ
jgi:hypothetical protein